MVLARAKGTHSTPRGNGFGTLDLQASWGVPGANKTPKQGKKCRYMTKMTKYLA